jgi:protease PrsW
MFQFIAVSAVVPSLLILWYFYSRDVYPEPKRVLAATFGLGALITIPVLFLALAIDHLLVLPKHLPLVAGFLDALLLAAVPEELFKLLVVGTYAARNRAFDEPMDGIVYGVVASLGFATLENVLYTAQGGLGTAIVRAVTAVPGHAFMGAIMGYFVGQAVFGPKEKRRRSWLYAGVWPILLHTLYDFPLLSLERLAPDSKAPSAGNVGLILALVSVTILVLFGEWRWSLRLVRRLRADQLQLRAAQRATAAPAPQSTIAAGPHPGSGLGWLFVLLGGAVASWGGLFLLGVMLAFVLGSVEKGEVGTTLIGTAMLGGLPLVVGLVTFVKGLGRLRSAPA